MDFIKQVSAGEISKAKDTITSLMSQVAFEALDTKKQEVAKSFLSPVEEGFEADDSGKEPSNSQKKDSDDLKKKSEGNTKALKTISAAFGKKNK